MAISLHHQRPSSPSTSKLHQALLTTLSPLTLTHTHLSLPQYHPTLLATAVTTLTKIYSCPITSSLPQLLSAILPEETLPILFDTTGALLSGLDDQAKTILYIQAVTGLVLIFEHLCTHGDITAGVVDRELRLFEQSKQKRSVLERIEEGGLLGECYTVEAVVEFIVGVIDEEEKEDVVNEVEIEQVATNEKVDWEMGSRPYGNMGLPWGFTIMALN
ncbi:hypothetical protein QC761_512980 [Podospora bellae-mahoneyi]|uniref:DNA mismatch repair protein HSM3 N-terminal domain-containing protein n=1 Tax=Podospora bellae-mahoneyi TaxID=2093777 RepID=A0ABR0FF12_9PEZI|nr:hypothetical protein QC761_512980 [Podospora bellae-mahoneyi]